MTPLQRLRTPQKRCTCILHVYTSIKPKAPSEVFFSFVSYSSAWVLWAFVLAIDQHKMTHLNLICPTEREREREFT